MTGSCLLHWILLSALSELLLALRLGGGAVVEEQEAGEEPRLGLAECLELQSGDTRQTLHLVLLLTDLVGTDGEAGPAVRLPPQRVRGAVHVAPDTVDWNVSNVSKLSVNTRGHLLRNISVCWSFSLPSLGLVSEVTTSSVGAAGLGAAIPMTSMEHLLNLCSQQTWEES